MVFVNIFFLLFFPFAVWWGVALSLQKAGKAKNISHAIGIGTGLAALTVALVFMIQTTERLPQQF